MSDLSVLAELDDLGPVLRRRRTAIGLTQAELAARSQISQADISRIESGALDPRWSTIMRLIRALNESPPARSLANGGRRTPPSDDHAPKIWKAKGRTLPIDRSAPGS